MTSQPVWSWFKSSAHQDCQEITSLSDQWGCPLPAAGLNEDRGGKSNEDGVQAHTGPYRTLSSITHRDRRCKEKLDNLPTSLCLTQSASILNVAILLLSLAFHEPIANMYQVIDGFCGATRISNMLLSQGIIRSTMPWLDVPINAWFSKISRRSTTAKR